MKKERIIELENINKSYYIKDKNNMKEVKALKNINIDFFSNNLYIIKGHSGSGKSTLLNIIGLIDKYDSGKYKLLGEEVNNLSDSELCDLRAKKIGFVFQNFNLKPTLKAFENVMLPMILNKSIKKDLRKAHSLELLELVGLKDRINHFPKELSGGEQQRVAIARALANDPDIILADEPTGNLDLETEQVIFKIFRDIADKGKCVIIITHSNDMLKFADKIYKIKDGIICGEKDEN